MHKIYNLTVKPQNILFDFTYIIEETLVVKFFPTIRGCKVVRGAPLKSRY